MVRHVVLAGDPDGEQMWVAFDKQVVIGTTMRDDRGNMRKRHLATLSKMAAMTLWRELGLVREEWVRRNR